MYYNGEDVLKKRLEIRDNIAKSLGIEGGYDEIEKARNVGDIHPNGKWVWKEYKPGKFDWRVAKKSDKVDSGSGKKTAPKNKKASPSKSVKTKRTEEKDKLFEGIDKMKLGKRPEEADSSSYGEYIRADSKYRYQMRESVRSLILGRMEKEVSNYWQLNIYGHAESSGKVELTIVQEGKAYGSGREDTLTMEEAMKNSKLKYDIPKIKNIINDLKETSFVKKYGLKLELRDEIRREFD